MSTRQRHTRYYKLGSELSPGKQQQALQYFVNRFTGDHTPAWVEHSRRPEKCRGAGYKLQFKDDREWLSRTYFRVTAKGELYKGRAQYHSHPTWPNNPEMQHTVRTNPKPPT